MKIHLTSNELFLVDFHNRRAGVTSDAFAPLAATKNGELVASTYELLCSLVPTSSSSLTVLDLACGDGYLLERIASLRKEPAHLIGVDISAGELAAGRRRLGNAAELIEARAQTLPLVEESVDYVLCHMALMLMDDLDTVVAQVRRVLKRGGVFSFIVGAKPPQTAALDLYLKHLGELRQHVGSSVPRLGDRRLGNPDRMRELLAGQFDQVQIEDVSVTRRYSPMALWDWFEGMYDLDGVPSDEIGRMKSQYIEVLATELAEDGQLSFKDNFRQVTAIAA